MNLFFKGHIASPDRSGELAVCQLADALMREYLLMAPFITGISMACTGLKFKQKDS